MTAAIDITAGQRKMLLALLHQFIPGVAVWAYGSRVKWTARSNSDLDLVSFTTPAQGHLVSELKEAFAESDLPFLVDFHVWDEVPERFHEIIRKEYVVLQEAEEKQLVEDAVGEWRSASIQEVSEKVAMGPFGSSIKVETFVPQGVPVISGQHLRGTRLADLDYNFISLEHAGQLANANVKRGDVVFTHAGNIGQVAYIPESSKYERYVISQRQFYLRPNTKKVLPEFIAYYFTSADGQHKLLANASSSGVPSIAQPVSYLRTIDIPVPPLSEQRAIAHILGTLDDKIELNRRMNESLEAMARALFQSWFVDFDPVRAKLDGRKPAGLDATSAALFPDHFQDSLLGHIPQGWEVCPLADKIELLSGGTPKTGEPDYWDGDIPWFSVKDAPTETDVWVIHTEKSVTELGISNSAAQIFPEKTTIITARGTVGKLALTGTPMAMNQSCYGVRGITGYGDYFTYYSLRAATAQLQQRTHGTVFDTITRQTFETLDCVFPPPKLTVAFDHAVEPLLEQIRANLHQSRTLSTLRDALLPRLMSGKLSLHNGQLPEEALV